MQRFEDSFTTDDGFNIFTLRWLPDSEPTGVILLVHGLAEHAARYEHVSQLLTDAGYAVYALDHRAHGRSSGEDRTYFESFDQPLADLEQYYQSIKAVYASLPVFVYGHSMGSLISLMFVLRHQTEIAGWISTGSPLHVDQSAPKPLIQLSKVAGKYVPKARLVRLSGGGISRDPVAVHAYDHDPLVDRKAMRVGMVVGIMTQAEELRGQLRALKLPILIMHGSEDTIAPASGSQFLFDHAGSEDKTLKIYDGYLHEIHNEINKERVFDDLLAWLKSH